MAPMPNITLLPSAKVPVIYDGGDTMTTEWYRFFWNIYGFTGTGVIPTDKGGTGLDTIGNHQLIIGNTNNVFEPTELVGSGISITYGTGTVTLAIGNSGVTPGTYGSATQVGQFTVDIHGTLTFAQNVPIAIDASQITSGTLLVARGGTGASTLTGYVKGSGTTALTASSTIPTTDLSGTITNAQLANSTISGVSLGGNLFNLTAGTGVSFSTGTTYNGSTAITINATGSGGTVTSVTGTAPVVSSGGTTPAISMAVATTSVSGYLTSTDWTTFNSKQAALVSGTNIKTVGGVSLLGSGDVGVIGATYGGTGVNNGANTITLAGNLTHAGAFTQTFTATANTSLTLPVSGTIISTVTNMAANPVTGTPSASNFLRGDGTWAVPTGTGTVTSVAATVPAFLSISGSPITTSGTLAITLSGTALPIANGGTGLTSFTANQIHYGSFSTSSGLTFDGTNFATTGSATAASLIVTGSTVPTNGLYLPTTNTLGFCTASGERARITAGGAFYVGCTSLPGAGTTTVGSVVDGNGYISTFRTNGTTAYFARSNDGEVVALFSGATQRGTISISGAVTTYGSVSDYRLKENVSIIDNALNIVLKLKPSKYNFKEFPNNITNGFIAHELQKEIPEAVIGEKDAVKENGSPEYQSIDMAKIVPFLTKAIQEQQAIIEKQSADIAALNTKIGL